MSSSNNPQHIMDLAQGQKRQRAAGSTTSSSSASSASGGGGETSAASNNSSSSGAVHGSSDRNHLHHPDDDDDESSVSSSATEEKAHDEDEDDDSSSNGDLNSLGIPPSYTETPEDSTTALASCTALDVLSGRGGKVNNHAGNRHYRKLIARYSNLYTSLHHREKPRVAKKIVTLVRGRGGRFLRVEEGEDDDEQQEGVAYYDIGDAQALSKTSQALRSATHRVRKQERQAYIEKYIAEEEKQKRQQQRAAAARTQAPSAAASVRYSASSSSVASPAAAAAAMPLFSTTQQQQQQSILGEPPEIGRLLQRAAELRNMADIAEQEAIRLRQAYQWTQAAAAQAQPPQPQQQQQQRTAWNAASSVQESDLRQLLTTLTQSQAQPSAAAADLAALSNVLLNTTSAGVRPEDALSAILQQLTQQPQQQQASSQQQAQQQSSQAEDRMQHILSSVVASYQQQRQQQLAPPVAHIGGDATRTSLGGSERGRSQKLDKSAKKKKRRESDKK